jgi:protein SCO1/2
MSRGRFAQPFAALACAAFCCAALAHDGHHASVQPGYARSVATYALPDAKLVDMDGKPFALHADLDGGDPVMLNFVFTTCSAICPVMSATFAQVQQRLAKEGDRLRLVSISIDPEHDTPARLREYATKFGAGPRWRFVTGSAEASLAAQRAFDVYRGDKMGHDPVTLMRAAPGEAWVRLDGFASAPELIDEYRRLVRR